MTLKKTLYNLNKSKNTFFNLNTGYWINLDVLKINLTCKYYNIDSVDVFNSNSIIIECVKNILIGDMSYVSIRYCSNKRACVFKNEIDFRNTTIRYQLFHESK